MKIRRKSRMEREIVYSLIYELEPYTRIRLTDSLSDTAIMDILTKCDYLLKNPNISLEIIAIKKRWFVSMFINSVRSVMNNNDDRLIQIVREIDKHGWTISADKYNNVKKALDSGGIEILFKKKWKEKKQSKAQSWI